MNQFDNNKNFVFLLTILFIISYVILNIDDVYAIVILTSIASVFITFINHRILIYLIFLSSFFLDNFFYIFHVPVRYLICIDMLVILLFVYSLFFAGINKFNFNREYNNVFRFTLYAALLLFFSYMMNQTPLFLSIRASLYHIRYILLFISLLILENDMEFYKKIFRFLIVVGLLQIPISIAQKIYYTKTATDFMAGSVSLGGYGSNYGSIFCVMLFSYFLVKYINTQERKNLFIMLLFIIPTIFSSARAVLFAYMFNFLLAQFVFSEKRKDTIKKILRTIVIVTILSLVVYISFAAILPFFDSRDKVALSLFTNLTAFTKYTYGTTKIGQLNRLQIFIYLFEVVKENPFNFIFGFGPGSHTTSNVLSQIGSSIQSRGFIVAGAHSFGYTILELGVLYLFLLFYFLISYSFKALYLYRKVTDNYWKIFCGTYFLIVVTFLYSSVYRKVWIAHGISFTMWFMTAALIKFIKNKDTIEPLAETHETTSRTLYIA